MSVLAIDQGTSATKAVVWSAGRIVADVDVPVLGTTHSGNAVEQDAEDLWRSVVTAGWEAVQQSDEPIEAVGIGNQGETVLAWNTKTGAPLGPALSWQDRRSVSVTDAMDATTRERLLAITGLPVDPYFAAPKMALLHGMLGATLGPHDVITTIDAWVNFRLTGEFVTDRATASRTQLLDPHTLEWSDEALAAYALPRRFLPELAHCDGVLGTTDEFGTRLPVGGLIVDQQAALFAQGCLDRGSAKCTYGTGAFLLANTGQVHQASSAGLATSLAWTMEDGTRASCMDGQVYAAGAAVSWLQRVGLIATAQDLDRLGSGPSGGVVFRPSFAGRGAPHWQPNAHAEISGLALSTGPEQIVSAFIDGLTTEVADLVRAVEADLGPMVTLRVDGGLTQSRVLMQRQADALGIPVEVYPHSCATALGVAALALRAVGGPGSEGAIIEGWQPVTTFEPSR
jgi:glycerol kinase